MDAWINGASASRAPRSMVRIAGILAYVGVRTRTRLGVSEAPSAVTE
jgi:hypothetical protein